MNKKQTTRAVLGAVVIACAITGSASAVQITFNTSGQWGPTATATRGSSRVTARGRRSGTLGASVAQTDPLTCTFFCPSFTYTVTARCFNTNTQAEDLLFNASSNSLATISTARCNTGSSYVGGSGSIAFN